MSRDDATLLDIAIAARLIQTFIQGMTKEAFLGDLDLVQIGGVLSLGREVRAPVQHFCELRVRSRRVFGGGSLLPALFECGARVETSSRSDDDVGDSRTNSGHCRAYRVDRLLIRSGLRERRTLTKTALRCCP